jgi:hypothetical protein
VASVPIGSLRIKLRDQLDAIAKDEGLVGQRVGTLEGSFCGGTQAVVRRAKAEVIQDVR